THKKRPSGVSALPVGKSPTTVWRPIGCSTRPFAVIPREGPILPVSRPTASATLVAANTSATDMPSAVRARTRDFTALLGERLRDFMPYPLCRIVVGVRAQAFTVDLLVLLPGGCHSRATKASSGVTRM